MTHSKQTLELGWCTVHLEVTDMISNEVFLWVENVRKPTRAELRKAAQLAGAVSPEFFVYINVDATNEIHMRFARHFGFLESRRAGDISVQVWDRTRCKPLFSH